MIAVCFRLLKLKKKQQMKSSVVIALLLIATVVCGHRSEEKFVSTWRGTLREEVAKLGLSADVTATLEESLFQKICATVLPLINEYVSGMTIPGQSGSHFSFNSITIEQFDIASLAITFTAPSTLNVALGGLSFAIPRTHFDVWEWVIFKITCSGSFWASLSSTTINLSVSVSEASGKLVFGYATSTVNWGSLSINHDFPNFFCKVAQDIIQLFVGNINNLIKKTVEKDLPEKIGPMMETALNKAFSKIPLDVVSQPVVTSDSISMTVDLLNGAGALRASPLHRVRMAGLPPRDIELQVPATAANNLLLFAQEKGLLNVNVTEHKFNTSVIKTLFPNEYALCPGCPFAVEVNCLTAPVLSFANDSIGLSLTNAIVGLNIAATNGTIIPFVDLYLNASLSVEQLSVLSNNSIWFQIGLQGLSISIAHSAIGPFPVALLDDIINELLSTILIPGFNQKFHGFALPAVFANAEIAAAGENTIVAFNLLI